MTYYPVPFFVSTKGYGFWLDDTWRNEFRLASERPDAWRVWTIGPKLTYEIFVPIDGDERPWPQQLVDLYTARTGRPMVPVKWAFGPRRRIGRNDMAQGKPEIEAMRDNHLALTTTDDAEHFLPAGDDIGIESQLSKWTADCAALGLRAIAYYNEYISADPSPLAADRQTGLDRHWFLYSADGTPLEVFLISGKPINLYTVDMTSADAVAWFGKMFDRALNLGYFGWMYDFGEYVQPDVVAANGMTGEELHNLYPVLYDKAQFDTLQAGPWANQWHAFGRSGYTGASQYMPVVWSGDPDASFDDAIGLPSMVRAGLNMGWSGVPNWGSDIGGYKCQGSGGSAADGELLARWIQYGSMGPDMHDENACANNTDGVPKATIWTAPDAMAAWSTYALLHTRLFPYLYANALEASRTGAPSQRSLFFEFPSPDLAKIDDQFMLGSAILVAPVVHRGQRTRNLTLPPTKWLSWPDGMLYEPGVAGLDGVLPTVVTVDAPLSKLPLFLRADHLVPLLDPSIETLDDRPHPGVIGPTDVAGVYDVIGLVYQHAQFTLAGGAVVEATLSGTFAPPPLPAAASEADLATCTGCWRKDGMRVRISASGDVSAGGLTVHDTTGRRIRWDLYLAP
jgi:alpha-glucosidase (family GH31 glycosyl hydrolase)